MLLMTLPENLSSYLVRPDLSPRRRRQWTGFLAKLAGTRRANIRVIPRSLIMLLIWTVFSASLHYIFVTSHTLPGTTTAVTTPGHAAAVTGASLLLPVANLASATHAQLLPGGPSGQLLPPGTMAPDRTYANNYARGQCTWYVAGRRQIPAGWGNAAAWYYHAVNSGWSVGTIPAIAAVAWTPAGAFGHVALVEQVSDDGRQVYISEMNYRGIGVKSFRWASTASFKYIY